MTSTLKVVKRINSITRDQPDDDNPYQCKNFSASSKSIFDCVALKYKTDVYICTLSDNKHVVYFCDDEKIVSQRFFSEDVRAIEVLPGAKFVLFCLATKIYVYTKSGTELYDCIESASPGVFAAAMVTLADLTDTLILASVS